MKKKYLFVGVSSILIALISTVIIYSSILQAPGVQFIFLKGKIFFQWSTTINGKIQNLSANTKNLYILVKNIDLENKKSELSLCILDKKGTNIFSTIIKQKDIKEEFEKNPIYNEEKSLLESALNFKESLSIDDYLAYSYYMNFNIQLKHIPTIGDRHSYSEYANFVGIFDFNKNKKIWENEIPEKDIFSTPGLLKYRNFLFVTGNIYPSGWCLLKYDSNSGKIIFDVKNINGDIKTPLISQNKIYVTSEELTQRGIDRYRDKYASYVNCIDPDNGKLLWKVKIADVRLGQYASPQVADSRIYVLTGLADTATLHCFSTDKGKTLWKRKVISGEQIFLHQKDKKIYVTQVGLVGAYDMYSGALKKKYSCMYSDLKQVATVNNLVIINHGGLLEIFDKQTEKQVQLIGISENDVRHRLRYYGKEGLVYAPQLLSNIQNLFAKPNGVINTPVGKNMIINGDMIYTYGDNGIFAYQVKRD